MRRLDMGLVTAMLALGCGQTAALDIPEGERSALESVQFASSGGEGAASSPITREVIAPGTLEVEDTEGVAEFQLTAEEFNAVASWAQRGTVLGALEDPSDCYDYPGVGARVTVTWETRTLSDTSAWSCLAPASSHPYAALSRLLSGLAVQYLACPAFDRFRANDVRPLCRWSADQ